VTEALDASWRRSWMPAHDGVLLLLLLLLLCDDPAETGKHPSHEVFVLPVRHPHGCRSLVE
jgi:hypothetical protein